MSNHNIPTHAEAVEYTANRHTGVYYIWRQEGSWYWAALGNSQEASNEKEAREAAKRWIRDGQ